MGNTAWQLEANEDELAAIGVPKRRGRGMRIAFGILAIASLTFVLAYYLPLHRSHAALNAEFAAVAKQSNERGTQLKQTLSALERVTEERDALKKTEGQKKNEDQQRKRQLEQFEWQVAPKLKSYLSKKAVRLERDTRELSISLRSTAFFTPDRTAPSPAGTKLLCSLTDTTDMKNQARFEVRAVATDISEWDAATERAGAAALVLADSCGVTASAVRVVTSHGDNGAPLLEVAIQTP
jgi:chemotaxis protein MotB